METCGKYVCLEPLIVIDCDYRQAVIIRQRGEKKKAKAGVFSL